MFVVFGKNKIKKLTSNWYFSSCLVDVGCFFFQIGSQKKKDGTDEWKNGGIVEVVLSSVFSKILKIRVVVVVVVVEYDEWSWYLGWKLLGFGVIWFVKWVEG